MTRFPVNKESCARLALTLNAMPSRARLRAEAMGFVFGKVLVMPDEDKRYVMIRGTFTCVCGRDENYALMVSPHDVMNLPRGMSDAVDPFVFLERHGSFSRKHLIADGYPPEVVDDIIERGLQWDRANPEENPWARTSFESFCG